MQHGSCRACLSRLGKIEGQIRGVMRMIEEGRYCIDVLTQISAIQAALNKVRGEVLKDHVETCVEEAIKGGDTADQRRKFNELVDIFGKYRA